jgi:hypothetical protein
LYRGNDFARSSEGSDSELDLFWQEVVAGITHDKAPVHGDFNVPVRPTQVIIHAIATMSPEIIHISTVSNSSCAIRL